MIVRFPLQIWVYCSKVIAVLLPILALLLIGVLVIAPIVSVAQGLDDQRDQLSHSIAVERRDILEAPNWKDKLLQLQAQEDKLGAIRTEPNAALASAGLQNDAEQLVAQVGGQIVTIEPLPTTSQNGLDALSMHMSIVVPGSALAELLNRIENHSPYIFIDAVSFQNADGTSDEDAADTAPQITINCTITAYRKS